MRWYRRWSARKGLQILVSGGWGSASSQSIWIDSVHGELITRKIDWDWDQ